MQYYLTWYALLPSVRAARSLRNAASSSSGRPLTLPSLQDGLMIDSEKLYTVVTNEILAPYGKEVSSPSDSISRRELTPRARCR